MNFTYPPEPQSNTSDKLNEQKMTIICEQIINVLEFMRQNKTVYKENKDEMLKLIKNKMPNFYNTYPRICRTLVFEDDISPLLGMIKTFGEVQNKKMSWEKANNLITNALNAKYVDPVLNSDKLVKEREEKQKSNNLNT